VKAPSDVAKVGDQVDVKVLGVDDRGKVRLSMKVVDQTTGKEAASPLGERDGKREEGSAREARHAD